MKTVQLLSLELGRVLRSRLTWLVAAITVFSPLAGLTFYKPAAGETMLTIHLLNPALAGGLVGGILFALLTIYEWDRVKRGRMKDLMNAAVSPHTAVLVRLFAIFCTALLTLAITLLAWLPYTIYTTGAVFDSLTYLLVYLIFMGLALPIAILISASAYQFTERFDLSIIIFIALAALSMTVWRNQWQLCWLNPGAWVLSDDFTNFRTFRSAAYMRFTWILGIGGIWMLSYLCIRQYGKGLMGSIICSARRIYRPALAFLLLACCVLTFVKQPFLDNSNPDFTVMDLRNIEDVEGVTCSQRYVDIRPNTDRGEIAGSATYSLQNVTGQEQVIPFFVRPGINISSASVNGKEVPFEVGDYHEMNSALLEVTIPTDSELELTLTYGGFPREWNMSGGMFQGSKEISSRYLCLENEEVSPLIVCAGPEDSPISSVIDITVPKGLQVIPFSASEAKLQSENSDGTETWRTKGTGRSAIIYVGDYIREDVSAAGSTVQFYYSRKHQSIMESANAAKALRSVIEYCTEHYGELFFASNGGLKLIQSRISTGGYASRGASLMNELDFTAKNLSNSDKGSAPGHVMIHEMVHQWWGLGNMFPTDDISELWTSEGLTTYTTYRILKELWGEDLAMEQVEQWKMEVEDYYLNFYVRNPKYLQALPQEEQLAISNSLSGVRKYSEMALKILKAEKLVGGEEAMDKILYILFNRELDPMSPYLAYQDFLDACGLTEEDLNLE